MRFLNTVYFKTFAVLGLAFILYLECFIKNNKDFDIFIGASKLVFEGKSCYNVWLKSGSEGLKYFYSPLFAVLLFPLKDLSQLAYDFIWMVINLFIIYRIFRLMPLFLPLKNISQTKKNAFVLLLLASTIRYILDNLDLGQMTLILVWASLESMLLIFEKKYLYGSALLALIINIKLIPVTLVFYLIYKKEFRAVFFTISFFILYLYIPALFVGHTFNNELLHQWLNSLSGTALNSIREDVGRPSLSSLIPSLLMKTPIQFGLNRNFIDLQEETVGLILNVIRLVILLVLAYIFGKPFQSIQNKKTMYYDLSLICLVTPLIFPHQGKYSFFYLLPAYSYCLYELIKLKKIQSKLNRTYQKTLLLVLISFSAVTLTTDGLIGRKASDFTEYFHFISYGSIALLIAMSFLKPKRVFTQ